MKEATGELNMTVVTVVAITAIAAFFYAFVWPAIKNNINKSTNCASAFSCVDDGDGKTMTCQYYPTDKDGKVADVSEDIKCPTEKKAD
ncbi:MAG: hypothetical protein RR478_00050 [Bacilli bacterium]